jgi:hypothetical protein
MHCGFMLKCHQQTPLLEISGVQSILTASVPFSNIMDNRCCPGSRLISLILCNAQFGWSGDVRQGAERVERNIEWRREPFL